MRFFSLIFTLVLSYLSCESQFQWDNRVHVSLKVDYGCALIGSIFVYYCLWLVSHLLLFWYGDVYVACMMRCCVVTSKLVNVKCMLTHKKPGC